MSRRDLGNLRPLSELLGPLKALATIEPPCRKHGPPPSLEQWEAWLKECDEAGISGVYQRPDNPRRWHFTTVLGLAFLRRWKWVRDNAELRLADGEAQEARDRIQAAQKAPERPETVSDEADLLLAYAEDRGL
jgi:hypothetical protein